MFILICSGSFGQMGQYSYKRSLAETHDQWHKIVLPDDIFRKINADFSDIRIRIWLAARFKDAATYYLMYGNNEVAKPDYDIERFADRIPATAGTLELGAEQSIKKETASPITPLFQNKMWLWVIMTVIIMILGWFSVKMMRKG